MTVRLVPETVIKAQLMKDEDLTAVTVSLWLYYSISPGFVKRQSGTGDSILSYGDRFHLPLLKSFPSPLFHSAARHRYG